MLHDIEDNPEGDPPVVRTDPLEMVSDGNSGGDHHGGKYQG